MENLESLLNSKRMLIKKNGVAIVLASTLMAPSLTVSAGVFNGTMQVGATVLSTSKCKFNAPGSTTLAFGVIDPSGAGNVIATGSLSVICRGSAANATFAITDDSGLYNTGVGAYRMQHAVTTTAYLGYTVNYSPQSATIPKNTNQTITVTGTITAAQYANAIAGNFADTATITVSP